MLVFIFRKTRRKLQFMIGDITINELRQFLEVTRPKQLKPVSEFPGYS